LFPYSDADVHHGTFPYVNVVLIGICALVFLYQLSLGGVGFLGGGGGIEARVFFLTWGFIPEELIRGEPYTAFAAEDITRSIETPVPTWVTIFSSMFMHGGFMHFAGNMMFLWVFGDNIEDRLGHVKYLFFYLFTGVVATLAHFAIDPGSQTPLVGASGAISGVLGAYLVLYFQPGKSAGGALHHHRGRGQGRDTVRIMVWLATVSRPHLPGAFIPS
jgi:membrane associated rhomboid family serine protease